MDTQTDLFPPQSAAEAKTCPSPEPDWASGPLAQLPVLSIRQPWASSIMLAGKRVENRDWPDWYRDRQLAVVRRAGRFLIHASKGLTGEECEDWKDFVRSRFGLGSADLAAFGSLKFRDLPRGGVIGVARFDSWVEHHDSPWFMGPGAIVMSEVQPLDFLPCRGALGFFRLQK